MKIGYVMFVVLWVVFCGVIVLVGSWGGLVIVCGVVGVVEVVMILVGLKVSFEWFLVKECFIVVGYFNVGFFIGVMIVLLLVVWVIVMYSWQMVFIIFGVLSFIWVMVWLIFYKYLCDQKYLIDEECDYIINGQEVQYQVSMVKKMFVGQILCNCQFWGIVLLCFLVELVWGIFNVWILLFMFKVYGFNLKEIVMFVWMLMLFVDFGCIFGGYLLLLFQCWFGVNLIVFCKMVVMLGVVLMIGLGMIGLFINLYVVIMLLCIGGFVYQVLFGVLIMFFFDVFGCNEVVMVNGLIGMFVWLVSMLFVLVVGVLVDIIGFSLLFVVLVVFDLLGVLVIWIVLQNKLVIEVVQEIYNDFVL